MRLLLNQRKSKKSTRFLAYLTYYHGFIIYVLLIFKSTISHCLRLMALFICCNLMMYTMQNAKMYLIIESDLRTPMHLL